MVKDFISFEPYSRQEIEMLLRLAQVLKAKQHRHERHPYLAGKSAALIFEKPSLRTRVTFEVGMFQLGGYAVTLQTQLGQRESVPDVARNLERWVDVIVARTFHHMHVLQLAEYARVPVINALTDLLHPCQILADALTLREQTRRDFSELHVAFVGDGNNVFNSWVEFAAKVPLALTLVCPPGYESDAYILEQARRTAQREIRIVHDIQEGVKEADAVYTDVWTSMGQESEQVQRERDFAAYQVTAEVMRRAKPNALFMHCLPAHRGYEVTDEVIDGPGSVVFEQAENRLHAQKAVLVYLLAPEIAAQCLKEAEDSGA